MNLQWSSLSLPEYGDYRTVPLHPAAMCVMPVTHEAGHVSHLPSVASHSPVVKCWFLPMFSVAPHCLILIYFCSLIYHNCPMSKSLHSRPLSPVLAKSFSSNHPVLSLKNLQTFLNDFLQVTAKIFPQSFSSQNYQRLLPIYPNLLLFVSLLSPLPFIWMYFMVQEFFDYFSCVQCCLCRTWHTWLIINIFW